MVIEEDRIKVWFFFFFQAEDGIRDIGVTGVQTCALPIFSGSRSIRTLPAAALARLDAVLALNAEIEIGDEPSGVDTLVQRVLAEHGYQARSEERRVGKSVDLGGRRIIKKKKHKQHVPETN